MSTILDTLAHAAFVAQAGRVGRWLPVLTLVAAIGLISLARPEDFVDTRVYDLGGETSMVALVGKYVRVSGKLVPAQAANSESSLGQTAVQGSRYVPLYVERRPDPLYVLDQDLPSVASDGATVELIGRIETAGGFPGVYLAQGNPPNIPLQNQAARLGIVLVAAVLGWWLLVWAMGRVDYAPSVSGGASHKAAAATLLWSGALGSVQRNLRVRAAPVTLVKAQHELRLEPSSRDLGWAVHLRQLQQATRTQVASPVGVRPAARIVFVDERGQTRSGTVAGEAEEIDALLFQLSARAQKPASVQAFERSRSL
jgi:hypothetical protein